MSTEPIRNPESQALVFPPEDPGIERAHLEIAKLKIVINDLLDFIVNLPKPAGQNLTLTDIRKKLNS